ncbi:MAG: hypothetical protein ACC707_02990 [Thiohalomonadales bacterium]
MSKTWNFIALSISLSLLLASIHAAAGIPTPKAQSPVSVSIQTGAKSTTGNSNTMDFVVTVSVQISTDNLRLVVQPPQGMVLNSGALTWTGSVQRGESKTLEFNASFSKTVNQILSVRAVLQSSSKTRFSARAETTINKTLAKLSNQISTSAKQTRTRARGNGRVVEYALP